VADETLETMIRTYLDGRLARGEISANTRRLLGHRLVTLERSWPGPADALDRAGLLAWLGSLTLAPASRRSYLSTIKVFCRWLVAEGVLVSDPSASLSRVREPRRVPRALSLRDVRRLFDVAPDPRARAIVALMVGCGLRCCEVAGAEMADWDQDAGHIDIRGKGDHERVIPVPPEVKAILLEYLVVRGSHGGPLICSYVHPFTGVSSAHLSRMLSGWLAQAGVKRAAYDGRSAHALRHTCASDVFEFSHDLRVVQEMLGHANLSTTAIYLRRADLGRMSEAMSGRDYRAA
jgi:site-specific recombinase XerC